MTFEAALARDIYTNGQICLETFMDLIILLYSHMLWGFSTVIHSENTFLLYIYIND